MSRGRFHIFPFGCQMNRHDAEVLAGSLVAGGYEQAGTADDADIILYMTCSVRDHAEQRVWSHLGGWRAAKRSGKVRALGVLGCMAERVGDELRKRMPHVDFVVGPRRIDDVPRLLTDILEGSGPCIATGLPDRDDFPCLDQADSIRRRSFQAFVAIMRGCDGGCTYCIVPRVRGREQSVPLHEVERSVRSLVERGAVEITLLGQNVDRYGLTLDPATTLSALLTRLSAVPGLQRLRFVTSHPRDITAELLASMAELPNVMPYLHVPAQSGSNRVLAAMRRGYTRERYLEMVGEAKRVVPDIGIASDFIVGFPGETDADFEETLSLVNECEFQGAFIFKYSPRPGTPASRLDDDVAREVKEQRHARLTEAQHAISHRLNRSLIGAEVDVLVEGVSKNDPDRYTGRTPSGRIVAFSAPGDATGTIVTARIDDATPIVLLGSQI